MNSLPPYSLSACLRQLFTSRLTDIFTQKTRFLHIKITQVGKLVDLGKTIFVG